MRKEKKGFLFPSAHSPLSSKCLNNLFGSPDVTFHEKKHSASPKMDNTNKHLPQRQASLGTPTEWYASSCWYWSDSTAALGNRGHFLAPGLALCGSWPAKLYPVRCRVEVEKDCCFQQHCQLTAVSSVEATASLMLEQPLRWLRCKLLGKGNPGHLAMAALLLTNPTASSRNFIWGQPTPLSYALIRLATWLQKCTEDKNVKSSYGPPPPPLRCWWPAQPCSLLPTAAKRSPTALATPFLGLRKLRYWQHLKTNTASLSQSSKTFSWSDCINYCFKDIVCTQIKWPIRVWAVLQQCGFRTDSS